MVIAKEKPHCFHWYNRKDALKARLQLVKTKTFSKGESLSLECHRMDPLLLKSNDLRKGFRFSH